MIVLWAVVVFLLIWTVRSAAAPRQRDEDSAFRTLDDRLPHLEIDRGDKEDRRRVLESHR